MCQMSVYMEKNGKMDLLMKNVEELDVTAEGVRVSAMFERPKEIKGARVKRIDFTGGKVILSNERGPGG